MIYQDSRTGHHDECDAGGPCEECGRDMPLHLVDDDMICRYCLVGLLCPAFTEGRRDYHRRGQVSAGAMLVYADAWAGEVRT